jgi:glutamate dehydrogenase
MPATLQDLLTRMRQQDTDSLLEQFTAVLYSRTDSEFLAAHDQETLLRIAEGSLEFFRSATAEGVRVDLLNPTSARDGWETPWSVLRVALGDRPFVVDSVRAELRRRGYRTHYLLHPVYAVQRDSDGNITQLAEAATRDPEGNEAFELYFIDRVDDETARRELVEGVQRVLDDVISATRDYGELQERALEVAAWLRGHESAAGEQAEEFEEYARFMEWLDDDNFIFLGYREYDISRSADGDWLQVGSGSGLGILTDSSGSAYREPVLISGLPADLQERVTGGRILIVTKTNAVSTVHRPARMDYIGIKKLSASGEVTGERRFIGLFTTKAQGMSVSEIPILRRKLEQVLELDGAREGSHDNKQILSIYNSMQREELIWSPAAQLQKDVRLIMALDKERSIRLTVRPDPLGRGLGIIVIMPRERFNAPVRHRIQDYLAETLEASHVDFQLAVGEEEDQVRLHFFLLTELRAGDVDVRALEQRATELSRSWNEQLAQELTEQYGFGEGRRLAARYGRSFDERYVADVPAHLALLDIAQLELLNGQGVLVKLEQPEGGNGRFENASLLKVYHRGSDLALSDVLPLLENAGFRVLEQSSYQLRVDGDTLAIEVFQVQDQQRKALDLSGDTSRITSALEALLDQRAGDDRLNSLLLTTSLADREIALLRSYLMYYSQIEPATSRSFLNDTLVQYPATASVIFRYFTAKFDPAGPADVTERSEALAELRDAFLATLAEVRSLAEDRALRGIFNLVEATVRTNFYQNRPRISFKLASREVLHMPEPRPLYEIAVSALGVEGTHLRGSKVARGGVRWSDRPDDFRSEVLGLMKTQMTKNAVIVPGGSKGGFVILNAPAGRDELLAYVREQYQTYVRALLDITDNQVDGRVVHPENTVIYDGADPYLVVAADKGTATFSDLANATAAEYGYWLGDAFATGGSHGYDHKGLGITARGAWQCTARHFRELGIDVKNDEFTAIGIGDMAGDVFGNGMRYTDKIRLQGAFNHLHVFLDPDPDAAASYVERERLYHLPRSTWRDYNPELISAGGGVFDRSAKEIALSPQVQEMLDVSETVLSGEELIRAVLRMQVDLLWNGGIGTYVKATEESNADVRDTANDSVRVNGAELRARVVGEGGNLGFTQLGRIEYALAGGRSNPDFIDNSGGVDLSDHEVNIKILFQDIMAAGEIDLEQRNELLAEMTDTVCDLVLANNYSQSLALSLAEPRSREDVQLFASLQEYLTERGDLDARGEFLPGPRRIQELIRSGEGYTRPELAVLMAYVKMGLYRRLLETDFPEEPHFEHYLLDYFPPVLVERYGNFVRNHSLRREITATQFTNRVVDILGITFVHRTIRDTGATPVEVIRAALIALEILDADTFLTDVFALDNKVPAAVQYEALQELVRAVEGITSWIILSDLGRIPVSDFVDTYRAPLTRLRTALLELLPAAQREAFSRRVEDFTARGLPGDLAVSAVSLEYLPASVGVIEVSRDSGEPLEDAARIFYGVGERLQLDWLRESLGSLETDTKWEKIAVGGLIMDLRGVQRRLVGEAIRQRNGGAGDVTGFLAVHQQALKRFDEALASAQEEGGATLAAASVLTRLLEQLEMVAAQPA